jgi:hypothetical protein
MRTTTAVVETPTTKTAAGIQPRYHAQVENTTAKGLRQKAVTEAPMAPVIGTSFLVFVAELVLFIILDLGAFRRDLSNAYVNVKSFYSYYFRQ